MVRGVSAPRGEPGSDSGRCSQRHGIAKWALARFFYFGPGRSRPAHGMGQVMAGTSPVAEAVSRYAEPLLLGMQLELVDVQFRREGAGWILRLIIDSTTGIRVEDCVTVSREISTYLDVEDLIGHPYQLEVSSPGLERPLKKPADYQRFVGKNAKLTLRESLEGRRVFTGVLIEADETGVVLDPGSGGIRFAYDRITKARLVY